MNPTLSLMYREWLQHRFEWTLEALVPLALALLLLGFAHVQISGDTDLPLPVVVIGTVTAMPGGDTGLPAHLPLPLLACACIVAGTALVFLMLSVTSLIVLSGLPRRDHGDRSIEFWLSLPVGDAQSLAVPLLVHLILVPAAALVLGWMGGLLLSAALVTRMAGPAAWLGLPWADLLAATMALALRLLAGLPLAALWLAPLVLLTMLTTAVFRRWGIVLLSVGLGLGGTVLEHLFGQPMLARTLAGLASEGARALAGAGSVGLSLRPGADPIAALRGLPGWALHDFGAALAALASPLLAGGLLVAAACFAGLVRWRQRGAGG